MATLAFVGVAGFVLLPGCRSLMGVHNASREERAKLEQRVGPFDERAVPLRTVLARILQEAHVPVIVDVCPALEASPVTLVTAGQIRLGSAVESLAWQVGAPFRPFVGEHSEVARPTLFCPPGLDSPTLSPIGSAVR